MADEQQAGQPAENTTITVHPGDTVQITDQAHAWHGVVGIVEATHSWGIHIVLRFPNLRRVGDSLPEAQERLKPGQFAVCGAAAILPPEILQRRRDSIETARQLAEEAKARHP